MDFSDKSYHNPVAKVLISSKVAQSGPNKKLTKDFLRWILTPKTQYDFILFFVDWSKDIMTFNNFSIIRTI